MNNQQYSAGVLPYSLDKKGNVMFLLGLDNNGWSDFGGHCEIEDQGDPRTTAAREFFEETLGSVMNICSSNFVFYKQPKPLLVKSRTLNGSQYFSYVVRVEFRDYRSIFKKVLSYLTYVKTPLKYMEKKDIRWFTIDDLERETLNLRPVFKNTYNMHKSIIGDYIKET